MKNSFLNLLIFSFLFNLFSPSLFAQKNKSNTSVYELKNKDKEYIRQQIKTDLRFLTDPRLEGRKAGELGATNAANYIKSRLKEFSLPHVDLKINREFEIVTESRLGAQTRCIINKNFVRVPEEVAPLPFSSNKSFSGHLMKNMKEPLTPWLLPLFDSKNEAEKYKDNWIEHAFVLAQEALKQDAAALILYDQFDVLETLYVKEGGFEILDIPVLVMSNKTYEDYFKNKNSLATISFELDLVNIKKKTENIYHYVDNKKDKTVVFSANYDYLGYSIKSFGNFTSSNKEIFYGADNNASGIVALLASLEIFNLLPIDKSDYNYLFVFYSASQMNNKGAFHFLDQLPETVKNQIVHTFHYDYIGNYLHNTGLFIYGLYDNATLFKKSNINVLPIQGYQESSIAYVYKKFNFPVFTINTGAHLKHGTTQDQFHGVNQNGIFRIVELINELTLSGALQDYLQSIPDGLSKELSFNNVSWEEWGIESDKSYDGLGVKILSLKKEKLGEKFGLKDGDIIFNINYKPIVHIEELISVLNSLDRGQRVTIKVKRDVSVIDISEKL